MSPLPPGRRRPVPAAGASVWTAAALSPADWMLPLGADVAAEIEVALGAIAAAAPEPPIPHCAALLAALRDRLRIGPGFALLRGLAPEGAPGGAEALLALLARQLGTPAAPPEPYLGEEAPGFHDEEASILALLCLRQGAEGQAAVLASAGALHNALMLRERALLGELYSALPLVRGEELTARAVFAVEDAGLVGRFSPAAIEAAAAPPHHATITGRQRAAVALLARLAADPEFALRLEMRPGDLLCLDPRRVWLRRRAPAMHGPADFLMLRLGNAA
ncbi:MAG TPA: TauD/TfdA family dioxygenase [Acetobacteraceae bacterium]|nr:TauD/TfdA family dioxygenase [Acetobacteraceae bacterium]